MLLFKYEIVGAGKWNVGRILVRIDCTFKNSTAFKEIAKKKIDKIK